MLTELKKFWHLIYNYSIDQGIRSILLSCWLYIFPDEVLLNDIPLDMAVIDPFYDGSLPQDRFKFPDPYELTQKMEMKLRHGAAYKELKIQEQEEQIAVHNINNDNSNNINNSSSSSSSSSTVVVVV